MAFPSAWPRLLKHAGDRIVNIEPQSDRDRPYEAPREAIGLTIELAALKPLERSQRNPSRGAEFFDRDVTQASLRPEVRANGGGHKGFSRSRARLAIHIRTQRRRAWPCCRGSDFRV